VAYTPGFNILLCFMHSNMSHPFVRRNCFFNFNFLREREISAALHLPLHGPSIHPPHPHPPVTHPLSVSSTRPLPSAHPAHPAHAGGQTSPSRGTSPPLDRAWVRELSEREVGWGPVKEDGGWRGGGGGGGCGSRGEGEERAVISLETLWVRRRGRGGRSQRRF
jgi:hypothetical protein